MLSRVGNDAIEPGCSPSVNASIMLPRTITINIPAANTPTTTLLIPNNPSFTLFSLYFGSVKPSFLPALSMLDPDRT